MFERTNSSQKYQQLSHKKTAANFTQNQEESIIYQVEAEREYVNRLKVQREKIESLYTKYDVLLKDLKGKESQIKQNDKIISALQNKCKTLFIGNQESVQLKQQNKEIKSQNLTLQNAICEMEQNYTRLHAQIKSKEGVANQKYQEVQILNDQLMGKLRSLTHKYQEKEQELNFKFKELAGNYEQLKTTSKKEIEQLGEELKIMKGTVLQRDEDFRLIKIQNDCLNERINELETYINELNLDAEEKIDHVQKEKKCQLRVFKNQNDALRDINSSLDKKIQKLKEECHLKDISLAELTFALDQHQKQTTEATFLFNHQTTQQKTILKEQLIQCQNHIAKLQRKIADSVRKEQCLFGKIKKYEVCLDAKRNLREIEKEELDRINMLLSLP